MYEHVGEVIDFDEMFIDISKKKLNSIIVLETNSYNMRMDSKFIFH